MENLQNSVHEINTGKVYSLEEARKIILEDKKPEGMSPMVHSLTSTDAVIYPVVFGFVFVYEDKVLLFADVADWKRGVNAARLFQRGYDIVDNYPKGVSSVPFNIIDME